MDEAVENFVDIELEYGYKKAEFYSLDTSEKRFVFAYRHFNIFSFDKFKDKNAKSLQRGQMIKNRGNEMFRIGDYKKALKLYSESIIMLPHRSESEKEAFSIALANRSAALYHIHEYKLALVDIDLAVDYGYPRNLNYKVLERKARCLLALKKFKVAKQVFRKTLQSLSESDLPNKKRKEVLHSIQEELTKLNKMKNINDVNDIPENVPVVASGNHSQYRAISSAVEIVHTDTSEYAVACRNIESGEILIMEEPHCAVLLPDFCKMLCFHCLKRAVAPQPCPDCCHVVFCSVKCQETALLTHHKYECSMLGVLWKSNMHRWFIALRMITQRGLLYFLHLKPTLKESWKTVHSKIYLSDDYRTVYNLRARGKVELRESLIMAMYAVCYLKLLREAKFFTASDISFKGTLSDEEVYIGGLILHNICVSGFYESIVQYIISNDRVLVGTAIFPTNVCFDHSCIPTVYGYYNGSTLTAQSMFSIKKGEKITVDFKLLMCKEYYREPIVQKDFKFHERDFKLYHKDLCKCEPCNQNWPYFFDIFHPLLVKMWFRCNCGSVTGGISSSFIWCSKCMRQLNTNKSYLQYSRAVLLALCDKADEFQSSNLYEAVKASLEALSILNKQPVELIVFYKCLETTTRCFDYFGNVHQL